MRIAHLHGNLTTEMILYTEYIITAIVTIMLSETTTTNDRRRWIVLVVVCLGQLMIVLDTTIVNVALPSLQRDLHFSQANLTWVVNAYLITYASFLLLAGRLGDLVGRKKVFLAGLVVFTVASALCGLAQDQAMLVAARFLQGIGGAMSTASILALIATGFPKPLERAQAMSVYTFVLAGGGSLGLLAGGVLTESINWHWIFFVNLPIGVATFLLGSALIEENEGIGLGHGVDVLGSILVTAALMIGVYAIVTSAESGWTSTHTLGFGGAAIALLAAFVALEARLANPILPLQILRLRSLTGSSAVRALLATGMYTAFFLGALYLEHVRGYSAMRTGLAFLPMSLGVGLISLGVTPRLMRRFGPLSTLLPGLASALAGLVLLTRADEHAAYFPGVFAAFALIGIGAGIGFLPLLTLAMSEVPPRDAGLASGIVNVSMQMAGALGLAVLGTVATDRSRALAADGLSTKSALIGGYHLSFALGAACVAFGVLAALALLRPPRLDEPERLPERVESELEAEAA
jgi:EmrB/QacA subfamily drug resistance transporter